MDVVIKSLREIGRKYNIDKVVLFGSRARNDHSQSSDYDIAITNRRKDVKYHILEEIEEIDTLCKIDVIFLNDLDGDELIIENIRRDGIVIMDKLMQKFDNYKNANQRLKEAITDYEELKNMTVRDGVIQRFEITTELAWKTVKEFMESEGNLEVHGPKGVMKEAFAQKLVEDERGWLQIIKDRNASSHIYDEKLANEIYNNIVNSHVLLLEDLKCKLERVIQ